MDYKTERVTDFARIEQIYNTRMKCDFAKYELKPLSVIQKALNEKGYEAFFLLCEEETLGYAFFVKNNQNYLLDYFAIAKEHRDQGLGSVFLSQLADCLTGADFVVVEVEDPDSAQSEAERSLRERRIWFYLRNGFKMTDIKATVFGVDYCIMVTNSGAQHTSSEVRRAYSDLYQSVHTSEFTRTYFKVHGE